MGQSLKPMTEGALFGIKFIWYLAAPNWEGRFVLHAVALQFSKNTAAGLYQILDGKDG